MADLEERVRERRSITLWLGTDDEHNTLSARDLYPNLLSHIAEIKNLRDHPYEFYQKLGFVIVGVMLLAAGESQTS